MVEELLVNVVDKITVLDEISWFHSVLVNEGGNFVGGEGDGEEFHGGGQGGYEFVLDAVTLPQLIIVFKECFDPDLLAPHFSPDVGLNIVDRLRPVAAIY